VSGGSSDLDKLIADSEAATGDAPSRGAAPARRDRGTAPARRDRARLIAAGIIGALIAVFAVVNLDQVKVHWLVTSGKTPLILVIAVAFLLGMLADRLAVRARRKRQS
jgi:uncharacterized integral membrane protein